MIIYPKNNLYHAVCRAGIFWFENIDFFIYKKHIRLKISLCRLFLNWVCFFRHCLLLVTTFSHFPSSKTNVSLEKHFICWGYRRIDPIFDIFLLPIGIRNNEKAQCLVKTPEGVVGPFFLEWSYKLCSIEILAMVSAGLSYS